MSEPMSEKETAELAERLVTMIGTAIMVVAHKLQKTTFTVRIAMKHDSIVVEPVGELLQPRKEGLQ